MSLKNMSVMFGAMAFMRRIDQEEPKVLLYARIFYAAYVAVTLLIYAILHLRILARKNLTPISVPVASKRPSFSETMEKASADAEARAAALDGTATPEPKKEEEETKKEEQKMEVITAMEYDLRQLAHARKSWITNAFILTAINYKMESVSPLVMSALMGIVRLLSDEPLVQIYVRGSPAVGPLKRPFAPEKSPFATLMKEMAPKPEESMATTAGTAVTGTVPSGATVEESDLHDDGDSEEDTPPPTIADLKDDHIKSDFDDDESKKDI